VSAVVLIDNQHPVNLGKRAHESGSTMFCSIWIRCIDEVFDATAGTVPAPGQQIFNAVIQMRRELLDDVRCVLRTSRESRGKLSKIALSHGFGHGALSLQLGFG
jgi:hypothetical protein